MSNVKKFLLTVVIGIVALILEFGFHQERLAFLAGCYCWRNHGDYYVDWYG